MWAIFAIFKKTAQSLHSPYSPNLVTPVPTVGLIGLLPLADDRQNGQAHTTSVTRSGKFSPVEVFLPSVNLMSKTIVNKPNFWTIFFHRKSYVEKFDKILFGIHFWRFFQKSIWSPC
jgi:hypothetical protein